MAVTIVGTLEQIFTSGGETVSEAVHVEFTSPTDAPLDLATSIVFPDRTPPVDVRVPLEAHLADDHGFADVARVETPRDGALAEWTATRPDSVDTEIVLWEITPLVQEGIEWGVTAVGDEGLLWGYQSIPIGDGAEATGEASIAIGYNAKSGGESSTAMGHDASAAGKQGLAVGRGSNAGGINSIAIGVDSDASGLDSTAAGQDANATNTRATAVGRNANASGENSAAYGWGANAGGDNSNAIGSSANAGSQGSNAIGRLAQADGSYSNAIGSSANAGSQGSNAIGASAQANGYSSNAIGSSTNAGGDNSNAIGIGANAGGDNSNAIGRLASAGGANSNAIGQGATVDISEQYVTEIATRSLRLVRRSGGLPVPEASTITLYDVAGNPHTIAVTADALTYDGNPVGGMETHSYGHNASPAAENLSGVGTYATAGVLRSDTLQSLIPEITTGLWDVDVVASAVVYRSVATGGVWLYLGNGSTAITQALGRLSPQTHAYTLTMFAGPNTGLAAVSPSQVIDLRYTGFGTAGTTYVVNHGWKITARRVG